MIFEHNKPAYDEGYEACPCFWGRDPGSLVKLLPSFIEIKDANILDAGCGEGKNAAFLAQLGARVTAFDHSERALNNGKAAWSNLSIDWQHSDIAFEPLPIGAYDVVIAYGLCHCLSSADEVAAIIRKLQAATKPSGLNIICSFNNRSQEIKEAHPGFHPTLLAHQAYLDFYQNWGILIEADSDLVESHPHNQVVHTHSMTRIIAKNA